MENNDGTIVLFPEFEQLKKEVEKLRTELSMLVLERDELLFVECKNLETAYLLTLGSLEYKAFELQCAVLRLKRKAELIQAKKNRQEKILLSAIEDALDDEFAEYQAKLDAQIKKMNSALERGKGKYLTDEETAQLKKLYRSVVKALHPDLHPEQGYEKVELFHRAVEAYENADLVALRIISEMVAEPAIADMSESGMAALLKEKERISGIIRDLNEKIDEIKTNYPYTMKELLQSESKIAEKKQELECTIAQLNELLAIYKAKIDEMLR